MELRYNCFPVNLTTFFMEHIFIEHFRVIAIVKIALYLTFSEKTEKGK